MREVDLNFDSEIESAKRIRKHILDLAYHCEGPAHLGGALSMVEMLVVLFTKVLNFDANNPFDDKRDRFILSKGHGVLALYATLHEFGFFPKEVLNTFKVDGSDFPAHPVMNLKYGIESSNGSLGHGLSMAVGSALALRIRKSNSKVYVILGDGECNEGSVWEAAMSAVHLNLNNLVAVIDLNGFQSDGPTGEVLSNFEIGELWHALGWNVIRVNGHEIHSLFEAYRDALISDLPTVLIAKTVKGKGVDFMENNNTWHHNRLTEAKYLDALNSIESAN